MGFVDQWRVTLITTDAAKYSEPFYSLAVSVNSDVSVDQKAAALFLTLKSDFDLYFDQGVRSKKTEAVKFLVAFASYAMGKDSVGWEWQAVRHFSQGLYESMEESPAHFLHHNTPLIEQVFSEVIHALMGSEK